MRYIAHCKFRKFALSFSWCKVDFSNFSLDLSCSLQAANRQFTGLDSDFARNYRDFEYIPNISFNQDDFRKDSALDSLDDFSSKKLHAAIILDLATQCFVDNLKFQWQLQCWS